MNLRSLIIVPALGVAALLTACETTESRRVVYASDYGPGYDYDDTDFYYVSGVPYSRSYGRLVVRDGGYYYGSAGRYYTYNRARHHVDGGRRYEGDRVAYRSDRD